jgi:cytochrome bd-type quinol oxidase subunit 1
MYQLIKIRPVGAELFHADRLTDRQTYMTKLTVAFGSFLKRPKIAEVNDWMQETETLTEQLIHCLSSCIE